VTRNRWKAYPEYKDSSVDWFRKIPAHWSAKRVKFLAWFNYGDSLAADAREDGDVPVYGSNGPVGTHARANALGPCMVIGRKGSFGRVNYCEVPCFAIDTTFYVDQSTARANMRWLYHALPLLGLDFLSQDAAVPGLSREYAHDQWLPDIPSDEQCAIAEFLDRETAKIDALIAKKERLIELLHEKRTALISRAVTKGLDPNVPTKDSGIEWLGQIPAHWVVKPLKRITEMTNGYPFKPSDWSADGVPIIRIENLNLGADFNYATQGVDSRYQIEYGDLLFGWSGNRGTSFGPFLWRRKGKHYLNQHIFKFSGHGCDTAWFYWALKAATFYVEKQAHGIIGLVHITRKDLGLVPMPVLRPDEQRAIAHFLDRETAQVDELIAKVGEAVDRLREYRTALISAAVTGKIDVREATP
jgi:type I restriction enzyme S subunit